MKNIESVFPQMIHQKIGIETVAYDPCGGLTNRELFAAMALQGLLSNPNLVGNIQGNKTPDDYDKKLARESLNASDALIEELNRREESN